MTPWKVIRDGEHIASLRYSADAAQLVGLGGGTVKWAAYGRSTTVWRENSEALSATDLPDDAAEIMERRLAEYLAARRARTKAKEPTEGEGVQHRRFDINPLQREGRIKE